MTLFQTLPPPPTRGTAPAAWNPFEWAPPPQPQPQPQPQPPPQQPHPQQTARELVVPPPPGTEIRWGCRLVTRGSEMHIEYVGGTERLVRGVFHYQEVEEGG